MADPEFPRVGCANLFVEKFAENSMKTKLHREGRAGFLRRVGPPTPKMGLPTYYFGQIFKENCMKMKTTWTERGDACPRCPSDPPMIMWGGSKKIFDNETKTQDPINK